MTQSDKAQAGPRLSVIVPTFERPSLLEKAYASLANQTFGDFEILVVDDASRDATPQKIAELVERDPRVRSLRLEKNVGPGAARNAALALCRGELVALLDDDDYAAPDRFARQIALLDERPDVDFVASAVGWANENGEIFRVTPGKIRRTELPSSAELLFRFLYLEGNYIPTTTLMARRAALEGLRFLEGVLAGEDWFLFLQLTARGHRLATLPDPLVFALRDPGHDSLMADKARAFPAQRRVLRELRAWLRQQNLNAQDPLYRTALAHQYLREARYWGGLRAVALCLRATLLAPTAPRIGETWRWLSVLVGKKIARLLKIS